MPNNPATQPAVTASKVGALPVPVAKATVTAAAINAQSSRAAGPAQAKRRSACGVSGGVAPTNCPPNAVSLMPCAGVPCRRNALARATSAT